jgi:hypothetical protein
MNFEREIENVGAVESTEIKKSQYQVVPAGWLEDYRKERLWGYLERGKMSNTVYYRLMKNGSFVGFKRFVTEYLPAAATRWQLDPLDHNPEETQKLSRPAMGIATLGREKISTVEQRRVTNPKSKDQSEPIPVPSSGGLTE